MQRWIVRENLFDEHTQRRRIGKAGGQGREHQTLRCAPIVQLGPLHQFGQHRLAILGCNEAQQMRQFLLHEFRRLVERRPQQSDRQSDVGVALGDTRAQHRGPREGRDFGPCLAQQAPGRDRIAPLHRNAGQLAQVVRGYHSRRRRLDARQAPIDVQCLLPFELALVNAAQRIERADAQPRHFAHLLEQDLCPVEQAGPQIILRERKQRLFPVLGRERGEMRLDGIRVGFHQFQKHVERPVGLLGHEIVESRKIVRMQSGQRRRPAPAPSEVSRENADDKSRNAHDPCQRREFRHEVLRGRRVRGVQPGILPG